MNWKPVWMFLDVACFIEENRRGARTGKTIEMNGGEVALSGTLHKTFYYELVWD
jgi:hypothetical protein